jgi:hypothetical protein
MKSTYKIEMPETMSATLTVTMTIGEWQELHRTIEKSDAKYYGPLANMQTDIRELVAKASQTFVTL